MKLLFTALLCFSLIAPFKVYADACKKVIISAHPEYPPYHWRSDNKIIGASIDITRKIFNEIGIEVDARYFGPWKRVLSAAQNSKIDMILGLKKTQEREQFLTFTTAPILPNPFAIFVHTDKTFPFEKWEDLVGKFGGKNAGDRYGDAFDMFSNKHLKIESSYTTENNINKLLLGRIDYFIHSRYVGQAHFATMKGGYQIKPLDLNINDGVVHSAFTKTSPCLTHLPYLSQRYQEILESGEAVALLNQNIARWANR